MAVNTQFDKKREAPTSTFTTHILDRRVFRLKYPAVIFAA